MTMSAKTYPVTGNLLRELRVRVEIESDDTEGEVVLGFQIDGDGTTATLRVTDPVEAYAELSACSSQWYGITGEHTGSERARATRIARGFEDLARYVRNDYELTRADLEARDYGGWWGP